jgi:methanogenic corrinoid protein MtbC1
LLWHEWEQTVTDFAARLRELRTGRSLRQRDLADALGVAQTTIANYEQGTRFPDEKILHKLADFFDVSLDYLLARTDVNLYAETGRYPGSFYRDEEDALPPMSPLAQEYLSLLLSGNRERAGELVTEALEKGTGIRELYEGVFERTLKEVGRLWVEGKADVATEHFFSAATQRIMSQLYPRLAAPSRERKQLTCLAMSVCGEFHDIGVRMVADFFEMGGWQTFFLGANLCNEDIVKSVLDHGAHLLALSGTMFFNVEAVAKAVRAVRTVDSLQGLTVLVGGRPFNEDRELWRKVQADGHARTAAEAVELGERLVGKRGRANPVRS